MLTISQSGPTIRIENSHIRAEVRTEGYVSGIAAGSFIDKSTGATDQSFGLDIVDFLLEPGWDDSTEPVEEYTRDPMLHGNIPKRFVELPQICTKARSVDAEIMQAKSYVAVRQWYQYQIASRGRQPGSRWEQVLVFPEDTRYFIAMDRITSVNMVDQLTLRIDLPGHLKHAAGDSFEQIYLSYHGYIPSSAFVEDFPPDSQYFYQRDTHPMPERMVRARQNRVDGEPGPWLAGLTLDPSIVSEAWCHQRGYVCFIQEIGCLPIQAGESFSAAYIIGYFDSVDEMNSTYDQFAGAREIELDSQGWRLV